MDQAQAHGAVPPAVPVVALIGDVVASRTAGDRAAVQRALTAALAVAETRVPAVQPLATTVGDEFQGAYASLAEAALAALLVRVRLLGTTGADTRYGLGAGTTTVFDATRTPPSQDGPAWWAAREAITTAHRAAERPRSRLVRTWYLERPADPTADPTAAPEADRAGLVNAFLTCRDEVLGRMSGREVRLLGGLLRAAPQAELAAEEGISQSAVSQALARSGAYALARAHELLPAAPPPARPSRPGQSDQPGQDG